MASTTASQAPLISQHSDAATKLPQDTTVDELPLTTENGETAKSDRHDAAPPPVGTSFSRYRGLTRQCKEPRVPCLVRGKSRCTSHLRLTSRNSPVWQPRLYSFCQAPTSTLSSPNRTSRDGFAGPVLEPTSSLRRQDCRSRRPTIDLACLVGCVARVRHEGIVSAVRCSILLW